MENSGRDADENLLNFLLKDAMGTKLQSMVVDP